MGGGGVDAEVIDFGRRTEPFCPVDLIDVTPRVGSRWISVLHEINLNFLIMHLIVVSTIKEKLKLKMSK